VITVIFHLTLETFLPEYKYHYSLDGNNKFVLCHGLGSILAAASLNQKLQEIQKVCMCPNRGKAF
jgi:hypothetical protein